MDLKDFISKTVSEIVSGLGEASKLTGKKVGIYSTGKTDQRHIEFDVAVTVENTKSKSGDLGIGIKIIQAGGKMASEATDSTVSRIRFGVRIS